MNVNDSVKQVLQEIGYVLSDHGREYRTRPLYRDSNNDSVLRIWKNSGQWVDFKENISGSLEDLVKLTLKLKNIEEAKEWISSKGITYNKEETLQRPILKQQEVFDKSILLKLRKDDSYWIQRGISSEILLPFQGGVASAGKMFNRYVFPIFNKDNDLIGFSGRDISAITLEGRPKWKHLGDKKEWVFPAKVNIQDLKSKKQIILVESIGDLLALRQNNINNALVTFGLNLSSRLVYFLLSLNPNYIIIAFNNDGSDKGAGNVAAENVKNKLANYFDIQQIKIKLPQGQKDFGEMHLKDPKLISQWYQSTHE
jgi:hypothetical protein